MAIFNSYVKLPEGIIEGAERLQFEIIPKLHPSVSLGLFGGPGILLINLCSTVLAANHWALQLVILPIIGFSALLFTVLALFIIPKAEFGDMGWMGIWRSASASEACDHMVDGFKV